MNIQGFRSQYPQYSDLSDDELARRLHGAYYSDMDFGLFQSKFIGLQDEVFEADRNTGQMTVDIPREEINQPWKPEPSPYTKPLPIGADTSQLDTSSFGSVPDYYLPESLAEVDPERSAQEFQRRAEVDQFDVQHKDETIAPWLRARLAPAQSFGGGLMQQASGIADILGRQADQWNPIKAVLNNPEMRDKLSPEARARMEGVTQKTDQAMGMSWLGETAGWLTDRAEVNRRIGQLGAPEQEALRYIYNGVGAVPDMAFELAAGALGGSPVALTTMYGRVYMDELERSRQIDGLPDDEAHMNAMVAATAEVIPEIPVFNRLFGKNQASKSMAKEMIQTAFMEGGSEGVTELIRIADDTFRKGIPFDADRALKEVREAAGTGAVMGPLMVGGAAGARKAGEVIPELPGISQLRDARALREFREQTGPLAERRAIDSLSPDFAQLRKMEAPSGGTLPDFDAAFNAAAADIDDDTEVLLEQNYSQMWARGADQATDLSPMGMPADVPRGTPDPLSSLSDNPLAPGMAGAPLMGGVAPVQAPKAVTTKPSGRSWDGVDINRLSDEEFDQWYVDMETEGLRSVIERRKRSGAGADWRTAFDPTKDGLLELLAKRGGLDADAFEAEGFDVKGMKERRSSFNNNRIPGKPVFRGKGKGGLRPDDVAELIQQLAESGSMVVPQDILDEYNRTTITDVLNVLAEEVNGTPVIFSGLKAQLDEEEASVRNALEEAARNRREFREIESIFGQDANRLADLEPVSTHDKEFYNPEWDSKTRTLADWMDDAIDEGVSDQEIESVLTDDMPVPERVRAINQLIEEKRDARFNERLEATFKSRNPGPLPAETEGRPQAEAPGSQELESAGASAGQTTRAVESGGLIVSWGGRSFPIESIEDAQQKWDQFRQQSGAGASEIGSAQVKNSNGDVLGKIAYNGRFVPSNAIESKGSKSSQVKKLESDIDLWRSQLGRSEEVDAHYNKKIEQALAEIESLKPAKADLLGQDTTKQQALGDRARAKEEKRSGKPGVETVPVEAGAGELFAGERPKDLFDQPEQKATEKPFDSKAFDRDRTETIKASRRAGNVHLDKVSPSVETMRGREIFYVHDTKQRGVIRTVDNNGNVYIDWADQYSADKELASEAVEDGKNWLKTTKDLPYMRVVRDGKTYVMRSSIGPSDLKDYAFAGEGSKKAPEEIRPLSETEQDPKFNRASSEESPKNLYVAHNLSAEKLIHANELGGLVAPSLAISNIDKGAFDSFGAITLLADPSIIESSRARTFDADAYSPRHPRAEYQLDDRAYEALAAKAKALPGGFEFVDDETLSRDGPDRLINSDAMKLLFLTDRGLAPATKRMKAEPWVQRFAESGKSRWAIESDAEFIRTVTRKHQREIAKAKSVDADIAKRLEDNSFETSSDGTRELKYWVIRNAASEVGRYMDSKGVDSFALRDAVSKKLRPKKLRAEYEAWVTDEFNKMVQGKRLFKGFTYSGKRRYIPYTVENILKEMTRQLQGGEGFNYGAGSVRAAYAKELKTVSQVQKLRDRIVSNGELKEVKEESQNKLIEALDALRPYYKYDATSSGYMDDASNAIAEGPSGWREAFNMDEDSRKIITDLVEYLRTLPTEYFETKMQRLVGLEEFKYAVVPRGTRKDVVDLLKGRGMTVRFYKNGDNADRAKAIKAASDILFERDGAGWFEKQISQKPSTADSKSTALTRQLEAAISRFTGEKIKPGTFTQAAVPTSMKSSVRAIERAFGKRVVFYKVNGQIPFSFNGVALPTDPKTIYVNIDSQNPFMGVAGHELLHTLRMQHPELYDRLAALARTHIKTTGYAEFARKLDKQISDNQADKRLDDDKMFEEMVANIVGDAMMDPAFINELAAQDRTFLERLVAAIMDILNSFTGTMKSRGMGSSQYFNNIEGLKGRVQAILKEQARTGQSAKESRIGSASPAFQQKPANDTFYSALTEAVEQAEGMPKKGSPDAFKQWLDGQQRKGNFKQEERDWMGVDEWLDGQESVTGEALQKFVADNQVQVEETMLANPESGELPAGWSVLEEDGDFWVINDEGEKQTNSHGSEEVAISEWVYGTESLGYDYTSKDSTKYDSYQLPGGENYRELLLRLPLSSNENTAAFRRERDANQAIVDFSVQNRRNPLPPDEWKRQHGALVAAYVKAADDAKRLEALKNTFRSSHYDEPNVLVHVRFNERKGADGKRILFIEEIQSDWHQKGRKDGYSDPAKLAAAKKELSEAEQAYDEWFRSFGPDATMTLTEVWDSPYSKRVDAAKDALYKQQDAAGVPDAPFKKSWPLLAMKRMIRYAAENGFDQIAWTTGEQQAERYDLSKKISRVIYDDNTTGGIANADLDGDPSIGHLYAHDLDNRQVISERIDDPAKLTDYIGKEAAEKLLASKPRRERSHGLGVRRRELSGLELKVGGEGMKGFYDQILPAEVNKYVKKWGGKVGQSNLSQGNPARYPHGWVLEDETGKQLQGPFSSKDDAIRAKQNIHSLPITPKMRQSALEGQPMFQSVYHGSPHKWDLVDLSKVGTGEGAQAFGWGFYAAENQGVAKGYQESLSKPRGQGQRFTSEYLSNGVLVPAAKSVEADIASTMQKHGVDPKTPDGKEWLESEISARYMGGHDVDKKSVMRYYRDGVEERQHPGNLYELDLPDSTIEKMLDWDKPLSEQSDYVKNILKTANLRDGDGVFRLFHGPNSGGLFYRTLAERNYGTKQASEELNALGIPGIKYLDGTSRKDGEGTRNFVVFDAKHLKTLTRNGEPVTLPEIENEVKFSRTDQTQTPEFREWFGDSVVTESGKAGGKPLVVYHGTADNVTSFDLDHPNRKDTGWLGTGVYMTNAPAIASTYSNMKAGSGSPNVMPLYTSIKNPYMAELADKRRLQAISHNQGEKAGREAADKWTKELVGLGYDGVILEFDHKEGDKRPVEYVAFKPSQVKSATGNTGAFSRDSDDIRFARSQGTPGWVPRVKPLSEVLKSRWDYWMRAQGNLPDVVFAEKIKRDNSMGADELHIRHKMADFDRAVRLSYGKSYDKLTNQQKEDLNDYLAGANVNIPAGVKRAMDPMRDYLDRLSNLMISRGVVQNQDTINKVLNNLGKYLNRSYQAFDNPNWPREVPESVRRAAYQHIEGRMRQAGQLAGLSAQQIEDKVQGQINNILEEGTAADSLGALVSESKLGSKDLSMLIQRKEIPKPIRDLLGEYRDARVNFVRSATKMERAVMNHIFLEGVKANGMNVFLFAEPTGEHSVRIAADASSPMSPLNGLYTTPEIRKAFTDALDKEQMANWYRWILGINGFVKYGKTVLSVTTISRNFLSASFFGVANGHFALFNPKATKIAYQTIQRELRNAPGSRAYAEKMKRLGVIYDNPYAGEMMDVLKDFTDSQSAYMDGALKGGARKFFDIMTRIYQAGDDFWKILGFEIEAANLEKHGGMTRQAAEIEAAERIRNTYPTYSMIGKAVKWVRRFPLIGTFVSFPAEIVRTSVNIVGYAVKDAKKPGMKVVAAQKLAGIALAAGLAATAREISMAIMGFDDDDDEAVRMMGPPWSKNSDMFYVGFDENGLPEYFDLSFLDPYNYLKRPLHAILRGDDDWQDKLKSALTDITGPFIGTDILAGALGEIVYNQKETGGPVYNPDDAELEQFKAIFNHLRKAVQPGTFGNIERMTKAVQGDTSRWGQQYKVANEIWALGGFRKSTLNPLQSISFQSMDFASRTRNASQILSYPLGGQNEVSDADIENAFGRMIEARRAAFQDMVDYVALAKSLGVSNSSVRSVLKASGVSADNVTALMRGRIPAWEPSSQFLDNAKERAIETAPSRARQTELKRTFDQRVRLVKKLAREEARRARTDQP